MDNNWLQDFIVRSLEEDLGEGDHSSMAVIPPEATGQANLIIKAHGILSGVEIAQKVFETADPEADFRSEIEDGSQVHPGDIAFRVYGKIQTILKCERLVLNIMQRMSGIATQTRRYADALSPYNVRLLDTRKTTPGIRALEKLAVRTGGGENHRMGLYDMIMLKDNHIDYGGGIEHTLEACRQYLDEKGLDLKIVIEARSLSDVRRILETGGADRILLDNFTPAETCEAVAFIDGKIETESSGGINFDRLLEYAATGVNYISVGALTHEFSSLDMSLKAFVKK